MAGPDPEMRHTPLPPQAAYSFAVMTAAMFAEARRDGEGRQAGGQVDAQGHCPGKLVLLLPQREHGLTYSSISAS